MRTILPRRFYAALFLGTLLLAVSAAALAAGASSGDAPGAAGKTVAFQPPKTGAWIRVLKSRHLLQLYEGRTRIAEFGAAVGSNPGQKQKIGDRRTPEGVFSVAQIQDARAWTHDFRDGKGAIAGAYGPWFIRLKTGWNGIGIHGTHDPSSIGKNVTEGCIRLRNENLEKVRNALRVGAVVVIEP